MVAIHTVAFTIHMEGSYKSNAKHASMGLGIICKLTSR